MCDGDVVNMLFPHLAAVEIEQVDRQDGQILVTARTRGDPVCCPSCGMSTSRRRAWPGAGDAASDHRRQPEADMIELRQAPATRRRDGCTASRERQQARNWMLHQAAERSTSTFSPSSLIADTVGLLFLETAYGPATARPSSVIRMTRLLPAAT